MVLTLTAVEWQNQVAAEVGGALANGPVQDPYATSCLKGLQARMPAIWAIAQYRAQEVPPGGWTAALTYAYARVHASRCLAGLLRSRIDTTLGPLNRPYSQLFRQLWEVHTDATSEAVELRKRALASLGPAGGVIQRRAPLDPRRLNPPADTNPLQPAAVITPIPDPNDLGYQGLPVPWEWPGPWPDWTEYWREV